MTMTTKMTKVITRIIMMMMLCRIIVLIIGESMNTLCENNKELPCLRHEKRGTNTPVHKVTFVLPTSFAYIGLPDNRIGRSAWSST